MLLAFVGMVLPAGSAVAAPAGVTLTVNYGDKSYDGTTVVEPGTSYTATLQYNTTVVEPGSTVTQTIPDGISVDAGSLDASNNEAIESINREGSVLTVAFEDPLPGGIQQGVFEIEFSFGEPELHSEKRDVSWALDGSSTTAEIIIRRPGDQFMPDFPTVESKSVGGVNLSQHVSAAEDGTVTVADAITNETIPYTIEIDSLDARTVTITDEIDDALAYDADSFTATLVSWDEDGLNRTEGPIDLPLSVDGNSFSIDNLALPANSQLTLTYAASVSDLAALTAALQAAADAVLADDNYDGGPFEIAVENTATIDGTEDAASVPVRGTVPAMPRPSYGAAFNKGSPTAGDITVDINPDGSFDGPVDVTYTLRADLTRFAGFEDTPFALSSNVVITDVLPAGVVWDGEDFLSVEGGTFTRVTEDVDAATFAGDEYVGRYLVTDDGDLWINVGQDVEDDFTFTAAAQITDITGGTRAGDTFRYNQLQNWANYDYGVGTPWRSSAVHRPTTPAPDPAVAFGKSSDDAGDLTLVLDEAGAAFDEDGTLAEPIDVVYELSADLTQFAPFTGEFFALERNVVIVDELPEQMRWADGDFLSVESGDLTLTRVEGMDWDAFAETAEGSYQVQGSELWVNVGDDVEASYELSAAAQIISVDGLARNDAPGWGAPDYPDALFTGLRNNAEFHYREGAGPQRDSVGHRLILPLDPRAGIDDPAQFSKSVSDAPFTVSPGERLHVPFTFAVAAGAVPDLAESQIIDYIDHDVFDLDDLEAMSESITGTYAGAPVTGDDFELTVDEDDNLVITTSDALGAPLTGALELTLLLPTHPIEGKQTITIVNNASLIGDTEEEWVWVSEAAGSATSYGAELEVAKSIYAGDGTWTQNFRVELDEDDQLTQDEFIYRVELIPHGGFNVAIFPMEDVLPEQLRFEGFVANDDLDTGETVPGDTVDMGGNIEARWNATDGVLHIEQRDGTTIGQGEPILVNFLVTMTDFTPDVPVTNYVGPSSATITPSNDYPLLVQKLDAEDENE
ncbi:MAG TPA: hypothetical protein VK046_13770, partial [Actinomycetaceae bacterium]|nr:hypothetical protein [Actinomycetaceae bacterium]